MEQNTQFEQLFSTNDSKSWLFMLLLNWQEFAITPFNLQFICLTQSFSYQGNQQEWLRVVNSALERARSRKDMYDRARLEPPQELLRDIQYYRERKQQLERDLYFNRVADGSPEAACKVLGRDPPGNALLANFCIIL